MEANTETALVDEVERRLAKLQATFDFGRLPGHGDTASEIRRYYEHSRLGYRFVHSDEGAMHMALNPDGVFDRSGYDGQARLVEERFLPATRRVLEVASGNGYNLRQLAARHPDKQFLGIDLVPSQVDRANEDLPANARAAVGDFQALDLPDGSQDLVFVVESFCHATDLPRAFAEIRRVLTGAGRFIVIDAWRTDAYAGAPSTLRTAAADVELAMAVSDAQDMSTWQGVARENGFTVVEELDLTEQIKPNLERLAKLAERYLARPRLARLAAHLVPETLLMNAIAGYLMPLTVAAGVHTYRLVTLEPQA